MSGMHLLPVYFTTTNHKTGQKKPQKKSKRMEAALKEHEKFLKKMGVSTNPVVGQAYNKGNYQVLSSQEVADEDTGKRRV